MAPIDTLLGLLDEVDGLDRMAAVVLKNRRLNPTNQEIQLEMDRYQTKIDIRRAEIEHIMNTIALSN